MHVSEAIARAIKLSFPELSLLAVSGTKLETAGINAGLKTFSEIFADRGYNNCLLYTSDAADEEDSVDLGGRRIIKKKKKKKHKTI